MARRGNPLIPAWNVPPGAIIKEELRTRGWTQEDLARIMGRPVQVISEIVSGKKQITPVTALGLASAFGTSAQMWLNMEAAFRLRLAQERNMDDAVERRSRIYSLVPVKELVKRGWIPEGTDVGDAGELERSVMEFFGVRSLDDIPSFPLAARRTPTRDPDPRAVRAWMRRVEQLAAKQEEGTFRHARMEKAVGELLPLSTEPEGVREVPGMLRRLGIRFVLVPHLPRTYLDGGVFAGDGNPILALTLRYDRLDNFWFTLLHELAHLVSGHRGNRPEDLDASAGGDPEEQEADRLAAEWLVPSDALKVFVTRVRPYFSRQAIVGFARSIGRHPAVVLGRLQHDGLVSPAHLRSLIPKVRRHLEPWIDVPEPVLDAGSDPVSAAVGEPATPYDPADTVLRWLRANPGWHRPAEIKRNFNLGRSIWQKAIRELLASGRVERKGEKRGTKYRVKEGHV